VKNRRDMKKM